MCSDVLSGIFESLTIKPLAPLCDVTLPPGEHGCFPVALGVSDNFWRHVCSYFRVIDAQYIRAHVQRVYLASEPPWVMVLCLWQVIPHDGYRDMFAIVLKPVAFPCGSPGSPIHDLALLASAGMTCTCVVFFSLDLVICKLSLQV